MTVSATIPPGLTSSKAKPGRMSMRPGWLRPAALAAIVALHASLLLSVASQPAPLTQLDAVEVTLKSLGDSPMDQAKQEEVRPAEPPPAPPVVEKAELTAPLPDIVSPEAIPLPVEKPSPVVKEPTPAKLREQNRRTQAAKERRHVAQEGRRAQKRGVANGAHEHALSRGAYAGLVAAELRRHQFYPAEARSQGATGAVGVAFTVGPSGRVVSQSITQSSGNAALDSAARAMMSAIQTPPPPGGSVSTSTTIRFSFD